MRKRIFRNWGLKLASLVLAFFLWFLVVQLGDPQDRETFYNIPVTLVNTELLDGENKVYEVLNNTDVVRVTVRAPVSVIQKLRSSDIIAQADMSRLTDINTIPISYTVPGVNEENVRGDHDAVRLSVEERSTKWIGVQGRTTGEVPEGFIVSETSLDQNRLEVTGPRSAIEKISYAVLTVDVTGVMSDMSLNVEPQLYDAENNLLELPSVTKNVSHIHMSVEVLATKEVPLEYSVMGTPADGYLATGAEECDTKTVMIAGTPAALANVTKITIPTEQLDITGLTGNLEKTINIKGYLPNNIRLSNDGFNGRVTVIVYIEPEEKRTYTLRAANIDFINVPVGYSVEISAEESCELTVSGLRADVLALPEEVRGIIDVTAWMTKEEIETLENSRHMLPVTFALPEGITIENETAITVHFYNNGGIVN